MLTLMYLIVRWSLVYYQCAGCWIVLMITCLYALGSDYIPEPCTCTALPWRSDATEACMLSDVFVVAFMTIHQTDVHTTALYSWTVEMFSDSNLIRMTVLKTCVQ